MNTPSPAAKNAVEEIHLLTKSGFNSVARKQIIASIIDRHMDSERKELVSLLERLRRYLGSSDWQNRKLIDAALQKLRGQAGGLDEDEYRPQFGQSPYE
jgi:hypothetical protein